MSKWQSERSIHEMLKDTPPIRESSDSITSGTEAKFPTSRSTPSFASAFSPDAQPGGGGPSTVLRDSPTRLEALRSWGLSTYKCTRQLLLERLGRSSRTVDTELEADIEGLRDTQRKYALVLRLAQALTAQLGAVGGTQRALGDAFGELALKSPELQAPFQRAAEAQRALARNGEALLAALRFFCAALHTLTRQAMEDTLATVRHFEAARVEYDAYRCEAEAGGGPGAAERRDRARAAYCRLRSDAAAKLALLHEHRARLVAKQLLLFHGATAAFFAGDTAALEATLRRFSVRAPAPLLPPPPPLPRAPAPPPPPALPCDAASD